MKVRARRALACGLLASLASLAACGGGGTPPRAPHAHVTDVVVVLRGADRPLPFDPRAGRIGAVARELQQLVGHPVVLELEAALSPDVQAHLEETSLASFENLVRELVAIEKHDKELFAKARRLERVVCTYDAIAKESVGHVEEGGRTLLVRAPPDRFPLLERGVATEALVLAHTDDLDGRYAAVDPASLPRREHEPYFSYMLRTRPGAGYLWTQWRRAQNPPLAGRASETIRLEHVGKILRLAQVVEPKSLLERRVTRTLLEQASFVGRFHSEHEVILKADPTVLKEVVSAYERWLVKVTPSLSDEETRALTRVIFGPNGSCYGARGPEAVFPGFDTFGYGLALFDAWMQRAAQGEFFARCVFTVAVRTPAQRRRLAETILKRRDTHLLERALYDTSPNDGERALELLELISADEGLFRRGVRMMLTEPIPVSEEARKTLDGAASRWWRDVPSRRGLSLFIIALKQSQLHTHYGDNFWRRWPAEFGGPIPPNILGSFLAEGAPAVEMVPKMWFALAKTPERDELVAASLPALLQADLEVRSTRAQPALLLLRARLCEERDGPGLARVHAELERWSRAHPEDAVSVSNALADMALERCPKP